RLFGIEPGSQVVNQHTFYIAMQVGRGRVGSKRVVISNKEIAVIFILHFDKILQCPEIITEVKVSCGPDAADNCIHNNVWVKKSGLLSLKARYKNTAKIFRKLLLYR